MKTPIYSALFVLSFVLATPNLGLSQEQDSSGSVKPATGEARGSGPATIVGQEAGGRAKGQPAGQTGPNGSAMGISGDGIIRRSQPAAQSGASGPAQAEAATPPQTNVVDPWQAILAAKSVTVIGMEEHKKGCSQPPFPCAKRAKEQAEIALRKWGRFTLVEDPTKADLVVVAMESEYIDNKEDQTWAQLRVFKGPATPAFLAQVQKRLEAQLRLYTGPVPLEKECDPLWEGWRGSNRPEVKNPTVSPLPPRSSLRDRLIFDLPQAIIEARDKERRDEEFRKRAERDPLDPQVTREVVQSWGDAIKSFNDLIGKTAKKLDTMVAEDFHQAVAEAEKRAGTVTLNQPQPPGIAAPTLSGQAVQEPPRPPLATEPAKEEQPVSPLMWLEVAAMLAGGRPVQDVTTMVKERGIAFDADREALWSLEALGAPDALLQAVRAARVENYYEPDPEIWADIRTEVGPTILRVLKTQPGNPILHFALARSLDAQEPSDAAIAEYREAVRLKPDFENAHINLGVALGKKGDLKGAIKELREVVRLNPGNALCHDNLGVALDRKGDLEGSVAEHREAVRLKPDFVGARLNLGAALDERGDLDGAVAEYRQAVRLAARYARAHYAVGTALGRKGDFPGARLELQEALRLNPNDALTHYVLGNVLGNQGDLNGAAAEYRQALRLQPDFPEAESNLAAVLRVTEDDFLREPGAAEKESRKAVRNNPADPFAHNALGVALLREGDLNGAIKEFREAVRLKGDYWEAHANLGAVLAQEGKFEEGIAELREALRLKPDLADTHFLLGQTLERKGDKAGALEAFRQAYALAPQNPEYKAKYEELLRQE